MEEFDFAVPLVPSSPPSSPNPPPSDKFDLDWCLRRTHDVALIYAEDDQEEAFNILTEMTEETNLDVRLQTDECFGANLVEKPEIIATQCWLVLVVQTHNTTNDMVAKFTKDELIVKIRITEAKDYIRPLCTEKGLPNLSGLASIEPLLWDPSAKTRTKRKIEDYIKWQKEQDVTWRIENLKLGAQVNLCNLNDVKTKRLSNVYDMSGDKKGLLFIINNYEFTDSKKYSNRDSSCKDAESLKTLFEKFGFKVETENNLTAQGIMDKFVQQVEAFEQKGYSCFATAILSHGLKGGVIGIDGKFVSLGKIKNIFLDERLIHHKDKPKLFFIQACQEDPTSPDVTPDKPGKLPQEDPALLALTTGKPGKLPQEDPALLALTTGKPSKLHPEAHFYWTSATVPGYVAVRDENDGSYFIECLVNVFTKYAHRYDLDNLMSKVAFDVERLTSRDHSPQIIERKSTLLKQLFFFPGI